MEKQKEAEGITICSFRFTWPLRLLTPLNIPEQPDVPLMARYYVVDDRVCICALSLVQIFITHAKDGGGTGPSQEDF